MKVSPLFSGPTPDGVPVLFTSPGERCNRPDFGAGVDRLVFHGLTAEMVATTMHLVQAELQRPVDVQGLARAVPAGLEPQVYMASLMAIDLDSRAEADFLHELASALDLAPDDVNAMHDKAGAPRLYR